VCRNGADRCVPDAGRRRGRPDNRRAPAERGRGSGGVAGGAARLAPPAGGATALSVLPRAAGRVRGDRRPIDGGESPRACPPSPVHGVSAGRVDAVPSLWGPQRRRHPPAVVVLCRQIAGAPSATGASGIDAAPLVGRRWPRAAAVRARTRARAPGAPVVSRGARIVGDRRHGHGRLVHVHPEAEGARRRQG
jgi:hypothetical protein